MPRHGTPWYEEQRDRRHAESSMWHVAHTQDGRQSQTYRDRHRLPEWREFCKYIRWHLPFFNMLIEAYNGGEFDNVFSTEP